MASLEIRLFGSLRVSRKGGAFRRLPGKRVNDLLAYLLLTREVAHARDQLAGLFWGDQDDGKARHCLNTALWRLRQALGEPEPGCADWLLVDAQSIGFNSAGDVRVDVAEFEGRVALAEQIGSRSPVQRATLLNEAAALYSADLLADCYDDWCLIERERLQRLYLRALMTLLQHHAECGEYPLAIELGHRLLARDPLREDVHRDLVHLYLRSGQPADALRQYRACEQILRQELGIAPMPETRALLASILRAWTDTPQPAVIAAPTMVDLMGALRSAADGIEQALVQVRSALELAERMSESRDPPPPDVRESRRQPRPLAEIALVADSAASDDCYPGVSGLS